VPRILLKMLAMLNKCGSRFTCKVNDTRMWIVMEKVQKVESKYVYHQGLPHVKLQWVTYTLTRGYSLGIKILHAANERAEYMRSRGFIFFFFLGGGEFGQYNIFIFCVFPPCSPRVFPIAPHFYPIWFAQSSSLLTYDTWAEKHGFFFFSFPAFPYISLFI